MAKSKVSERRRSQLAAASARYRADRRKKLYEKMSCGEFVTYDEFPTGLSFRDVRAMLWSPDDDSSMWRYKRRGTVLGTWRALKRALYDRYCGEITRGAGR